MRCVLFGALLLVACGQQSTIEGPAGEPGVNGSDGQPGPAGRDGDPGPAGQAGPASGVSLCALSVPTTGDLGGYVGAGDLCADICGGQGHMCTAHELSVLRQRGHITGSVWADDPPDNCDGWTSASPYDVGAYDVGAEVVCSAEVEVACCTG